jgi:hypothetical protein
VKNRRALCLVLVILLALAAAPTWAHEKRVAPAAPAADLAAWLSAAWSSFTALWASIPQAGSGTVAATGNAGSVPDTRPFGGWCIDPNGAPVNCQQNP